MTDLVGGERADYVQKMFARVAPNYDRMNRLMTLWQDVRWRRDVVRLADLPPAGRVLDIGTGTGDLALESLKQCSDCSVVAADFTIEMIQAGWHGDNNGLDDRNGVAWVSADAACLPYQDEYFDAVISGFLVRNLSDVSLSLQEQYRVLKPGGRIVILDTSPPPKNILLPFIQFHMHTIIPALGRMVAGYQDAYHYLPDSTELFLQPEQLASRMIETGFHDVAFCRYMLGTVVISWGIK